MTVEIYTTPTCGYCQLAKRFLAEKGIQYIEHDVSKDRRAAENMVNTTGQMAVPVIIVDGEVIIGFNRPRLEKLLGTHSEGKVNLGLSITDASSIIQDSVSRAQSGVYIGNVKNLSLGAKAGLMAGDIITKINSVQIYSASDMERVVASLHSGDRVSFTVNRDSDYLSTEIVI